MKTLIQVDHSHYRPITFVGLMYLPYLGLVEREMHDHSIIDIQPNVVKSNVNRPALLHTEPSYVKIDVEFNVITNEKSNLSNKLEKPRTLNKSTGRFRSSGAST